MQYTIQLTQDGTPFIHNSVTGKHLYAGTNLEAALKVRDVLNSSKDTLISVTSSPKGFYYKTTDIPYTTPLITWPEIPTVPEWPHPITPVSPVEPITIPSSPIDIPLTPLPQPVTGWVCPVCGGGVSPYTQVCPCTKQSYTFTYTNSTSNQQ